MKSILYAILLTFFALSHSSLYSQDTLPDFTVKNRFGKIILSWVNSYAVIKQISIQRSTDSLKGFKTILTVPDPTAITNGFLDVKAPDLNSYYKLYILLDNGKYLFSKSKKPFNDSATEKSAVVENPETKIVQPNPNDPSLSPQEVEIIKKYELATASTNSRKKSDGLKADSSKATVPKDLFIPSSFVYTNPDGNITIAVTDSKKKSYTIKFFEDDGTPIFEITKLKENIMILDKVNFLHSGWFKFELYENGVLKEKHKFFIPKDGSSR